MRSLKLTYYIGILLMFITSMYPWFVWNNNITLYSCLFTFIVAISCISFQPGMFRLLTGKDVLFMVVLIGVMMYDSLILNIHGKIENLLLGIVVYSVLRLRPKYHEELLSFITKSFAVILFISIVAYVLYFLGLLPISPEYIELSDGRYLSQNYYFFILTINDTVADYIRFKSIFMEPGHLTMGLIPLIFANKFNLRSKYVLILFVAAILSFSLAAYVVMFVGYILLYFNFRSLRKLLAGIVSFLLVIFIIDRTGNSEVLDVFLWERLEITEDGTIAGDNRVTDEFQRVYEHTISGPNALWGDNTVDVTSYAGISGYKKYIVQHGFLGVILVSVLFLFFTLSNRDWPIFVYSIVFLLLLYQNAYPFWYCVILMYTLGCCIYRENENIVHST